MVMCFSPDCKHYSEKHGCRFFTFPKDDKLKKIWIKLLRRADRSPVKTSRVCSCHFKDEERENLPTLFLHNIDKKNLLIESPKRKKSRVMKSGPSSSDINASNNDTFSGMAELDVQKLDSNIDVHLQILADKGFLINDILPPGVSVNVPPFLSSPQFTPSQIKLTSVIAKARIHVERAIRRIKTYKILQFIPNNFFPHSSKIFQVCAALTNLQNPLIKEVEPLMV